MKRAAPGPGQGAFNFFDVPAAPAHEEGSLDISQHLRQRLSDLLARCGARGVDRYEMAAQISRLSGREVTKNMLDRYSAPACEDWRFPAELIPAITIASGDFALLELVVESCSCKALRGEEAMLAEIGALMMQQRAAGSRLEQLKKSAPDLVINRLVEEALKRLSSGGRK